MSGYVRPFQAQTIPVLMVEGSDLKTNMTALSKKLTAPENDKNSSEMSHKLQATSLASVKVKRFYSSLS